MGLPPPPLPFHLQPPGHAQGSFPAPLASYQQPQLQQPPAASYQQAHELGGQQANSPPAAAPLTFGGMDIPMPTGMSAASAPLLQPQQRQQLQEKQPPPQPQQPPQQQQPPGLPPGLLPPHLLMMPPGSMAPPGMALPPGMLPMPPMHLLYPGQPWAPRQLHHPGGFPPAAGGGGAGDDDDDEAPPLPPEEEFVPPLPESPGDNGDMDVSDDEDALPPHMRR